MPEENGRSFTWVVDVLDDASFRGCTHVRRIIPVNVAIESAEARGKPESMILFKGGKCKGGKLSKYLRRHGRQLRVLREKGMFICCLIRSVSWAGK